MYTHFQMSVMKHVNCLFTEFVNTFLICIYTLLSGSTYRQEICRKREWVTKFCLEMIRGNYYITPLNHQDHFRGWFLWFNILWVRWLLVLHAVIWLVHLPLKDLHWMNLLTNVFVFIVANTAAKVESQYLARFKISALTLAVARSRAVEPCPNTILKVA